jgi:hypothetical protein
LRLANLPNFALDRLSRYEATLWRHAGQILFALWIGASHKRGGAVSASVAGTACRPMDETTVKLPGRRIYVIDAKLG